MTMNSPTNNTTKFIFFAVRIPFFSKQLPSCLVKINLNSNHKSIRISFNKTHFNNPILQISFQSIEKALLLLFLVYFQIDPFYASLYLDLLHPFFFQKIIYKKYLFYIEFHLFYFVLLLKVYDIF